MPEEENIKETKQENQEKEINLVDLKEEVIKVLKNCYDPEIPVNIYDLGLIYDIGLAKNGDVLVLMTLTSPACPVAGSLPSEIQEKLREHPMIHDARVEITFDPPWSLDKMSEEAKLELGFL
jgi:FeS assembly SUF system protein